LPNKGEHVSNKWTDSERADAVRDAMMWRTERSAAGHTVTLRIAGVEVEVSINQHGVPCLNLVTGNAHEDVNLTGGGDFSVNGRPAVLVAQGPRSEEREQLYRDILTTAFESGIDYWVDEFADVTCNENSEVLSVRVRPEEEDEWYTVTVDDIERGWWMFQRMYRAGKHNGWGSHRTSLVDCGEHLDELDIDSAVADDIFQLAAFGEIVYA
jgi:hypothetical protein